MLTITANDAARFAGQTDTAGYNGVSYSGFVNGESSSNLSALPTIVRSNISEGAAGTYQGKLVASGAAANNYSFSYVNGNYTIVPADRLLVRLNNVSNEYGSSPTYTLAEAKYMLPDNSIVNLLNVGSGTATVTAAGRVTITDVSGASASFKVVPSNGAFSSAGLLTVGTYQIGRAHV